MDHFTATVIGTLAVDGLAINLVRRQRPGRVVASPIHLPAVPNITAHPSMASVPASYYLMCHYNYLWTLNG